MASGLLRGLGVLGNLLEVPRGRRSRQAGLLAPMVPESSNMTETLSGRHRGLILICALLAWMCAGILMAIPPLAARPAVAAMGVTDEALRGRWFSWYVCAFLLGAAAGGYGFGWLGDRLGRANALGWSVLTYSLLAGACYFVRTPEQLLVLWFLACTGVGGVWPNGVTLVSEALPGFSRPWISGLYGTTANLGLMLLALLAVWQPITIDNWRWVFLVACAPAVIGVIVLAFVSESPEKPMNCIAEHGRPLNLSRYIRRMRKYAGQPCSTPSS